MVNNIDVKILKSRTRVIWNIDALPPDDQYLEQREHQRNKSWYFPLNDQYFIPTSLTMASQCFCLAAVFCKCVSPSEYWQLVSIISKSFNIIEASVNIFISAHEGKQSYQLCNNNLLITTLFVHVSWLSVLK